MKLRLRQLESTVVARMEAILDRAIQPQGFINRVIYPMYQKAQIERWQTENESEGKRWKPLNPDYREAKKRIYREYPYAGTRMLIATGTLFKSVVGTMASFHRKIVTMDGLVVMTTVPYAQDVADARPFMEFSPRSKTVREMRQAYREWLRG